MTKNKAIKLFEYYYEKAANYQYVNNKVAWALYQVWKEANNDQ